MGGAKDLVALTRVRVAARSFAPTQPPTRAQDKVAITIERALRHARVPASDIDLVIPTGVQAASWPILLRLCGIPEGRLFQPHHRFGHTIAADSFLLLEEAIHHQQIRPGMTVLLFAYGFGSSWCALVLEALSDC